MEFEKANDLINEIQIFESELRLVCESVEDNATHDEGILAGIILKLLTSTMAEVDRLQKELQAKAPAPALMEA
ncbi:MAG: hypothetical protein CVU64_17550 [Deltaproteobacteria bacterium HGW-Deltaproteobacteria-21]|nr:MAG: hypothetical protein CVU64_17550 [Deltaproteobacteria bacterium HGW-Deltaproteobacteria-21]